MTLKDPEKKQGSEKAVKTYVARRRTRIRINERVKAYQSG
jgi:hypothetical protein